MLHMPPNKYVGKFPAEPAATQPFKLDEGYSDETKSQSENEVVQGSEDPMTLPGWILAYSEADRAELAYTLLRTLRTSSIAAVVNRLTPILHMDPVLKLPPEITAEIFSYLDPQTLLTASAASREWRARILDSRLWRHLYLREGWRLDLPEIRNFEQQCAGVSPSQHRKSRTRHSDTDMGQPKLKKRVPSGYYNGATASDGSPPWDEQHSKVEADGVGASTSIFPHDAEGDHEMRDASFEDPSPKLSTHRRSPSSLELRGLPHSRGSSVTDQLSTASASTSSSTDSRTPSLFTRLPDGTVKLDWAYLYRQRRRLEENWRKGKFTNFQLPHPSYPQEAHSECVYAIQFVGKWLVSGSRDRSLRVWDLETRRLRGPPLIGHDKSILCLQFDPSEEEDIIASGSSDRSVVIWRFSTGEVIRKLPNAHQDSVLNLRFDSRYLVTCSKDKLIKVWNRRDLRASDENYPSIFKGTGVRYPSYIVDTSIIPPSILESHIENGSISTLQPYSLLMTLDGHYAAVNAIQIDENEIVSASGDRLIKVWDIHSGACLKTLIGHQKGIACVQFDSRRIVSGSNDNTVRIYDHVSGAEVACLQGHSALVRTVQAGFGDPPGADEAMRLEAMAVDNDFWEAYRRGDTIAETASGSSQRRRGMTRRSGSRNPKDIMAIGAKIPPGGGGSIWGRIVSGSYDETIIIWKRDREGNWVIGQKLRQEDAANAASGVSVSTSSDNSPNQASQPQQTNTQPGSSQQMQGLVTSQNQQPMNPQHANAFAQAASRNNGATLSNQLNHLVHLNQVAPNLQQATQQHPAVTVPQSQVQPQWNVHSNTIPPAEQPQSLQQQQQQQMAAHQTNPMNPNHPHAPHPNANALDAAVLQNAPHLQHTGNNNNRPVPHDQHPTARVFRLQFDARKLICASQDARIVGWDFAYGDEELAEASRFFAGL